MNINKNFLTEVIKYLISRGVTLTDVLDTFNEHFNTLDAFSDSLKNMPTEIKRGTINNVIEEPVLPKYTITESDKVSLESVSLSPETLNKVFETSKEHEKHDEVRKPITDIDLLLCGRSVEESSTPEKATESVTNATALNGNNVTAVIPDTHNPDAIREDKNDVVEKALKKFVTHSEESKKDKNPKEVKADLTVLEVCQKMNVTTHELREMVNSGEFPQPDCDKKWSVKLLKKEGII